ncbi:hypothetical protein [Paenirhodobacter populi]|uniref:hypothetical protein n=1 Tax=Paenirhodobacter populi TaxID=2306993 RepID=UPI0013E36B39|nr:hypothetical protein [Sinirhodobacter populi]
MTMTIMKICGKIDEQPHDIYIISKRHPSPCRTDAAPAQWRHLGRTKIAVQRHGNGTES